MPNNMGIHYNAQWKKSSPVYSSFPPERRYFCTQMVTYLSYAHIFREKTPCSEEKYKHTEALIMEIERC